MIAVVEKGTLGWFQPIYYVTMFVLSVWFFGPLFFKFTYFLMTKPLLLSYDQYHVFLRNRKSIPWSSIKKIEIIGSTTNKLAQPVPDMYRLTLLNRSQIDISTHFLLTNKELTDGFKTLQTAWSQNKHRKNEGE